MANLSQFIFGQVFNGIAATHNAPAAPAHHNNAAGPRKGLTFVTRPVRSSRSAVMSRLQLLG